MAIRDRAKYGGSYHGNVALTAYNAVSLLPEVGLYQPEIVKKLQERYQWYVPFRVIPRENSQNVIGIYSLF